VFISFLCRREVSERFPNKVFLEETNLSPEFAFRIDSRPNHKNLEYRSFSMNLKPEYENSTLEVIGATDKDLTNIYPFYSRFRCKLPKLEDHKESGDDSESGEGDEKLSAPGDNAWTVNIESENFFHCFRIRKLFSLLKYLNV